MAIFVRLLADHEIHLANSFFNNIYGVSRSLSHFRWEFMEGPFGKAIYVVAIDEDNSTNSEPKIVGIQCAIPIELLDGKGNTLRTAKSEDTLVDPSYRGQKIFERMYALLFTECQKNGIKYIWGFTPAQKAFERIGFEIPFKAEQALMVYHPRHAFQHLKSLNAKNTFKDKGKIWVLTVLSFLKGLASRKPAMDIKEGTLENKNDLFKRYYGSTEYYALNETNEYMRWRLLDNPFANKYLCYQAWVQGEVVADVIINLRKEVSYIERIYLKDGVDLKALLVAISKKCRESKSPLLRALCFSTNDHLRLQGRALSAAGFFYLDRGSFFVWKGLDPAVDIDPRQLLINRLFTQGNV